MTSGTAYPAILALDTAQEDCGAALLLPGGECFECVERVGSRHSERVLSMVRDLLSEAGLDKRSIGLVAFGEGPGSFTGLRVACGVAQGLAWALEIPTAPVSNLEAEAEWLRSAQPDAGGKVIAVLNDARMQECYAGAWRIPEDPQARLERLSGPVLIKPADAQAYLDNQHAAFLCGSAREAYFKGTALEHFPGGMAAASRPVSIARIARWIFDEGKTVRPELAHPVYVRDRVALTMAERAAGERL